MDDPEATSPVAVVEPTSLSQALRMRRGEGIGARVTWSIREVLAGITLTVLGYFFVPLIFIGPALVAGYDEEDSLVLGLALAASVLWNGLMVLLVGWIVRRKLRRPWTTFGESEDQPTAPEGSEWQRLGWRSPWSNQAWSGGKIAGLIVAGLVSMWVIQGVYVGLINALGLDSLLPDQQFPDGIFDEWWLIALFGVAVIFSAPIAEELFFRGFVFGGLRRRFGFLAPSLTTGALFSLAHLQVGLLVPFSLIGMVLSLVYERTGSIWFNIALHMIFNTASFLALVLIPDARSS
jgi:membrane protease YdiL (CAAX protease family)